MMTTAEVGTHCAPLVQGPPRCHLPLSLVFLPLPLVKSFDAGAGPNVETQLHQSARPMQLGVLVAALGHSIMENVLAIARSIRTDQHSRKTCGFAKLRRH